MAKSRAPLIWLYALSLLAIGFIWGNSLLSQSASGAFSSRVEAWLLRLLHLEALPFDVRKLAHFCEYAALARFPARHSRFRKTILLPAC